ncbi:unnamed protein product [Clavelina lepadiformis]|uniref:Major facilitator superfamily (MFS) profile domain-containing protein n=1 Tax=Clavelina lepadiformis TaxID=159417 RepID=A0ABP0G5A3_CLALP
MGPANVAWLVLLSAVYVSGLWAAATRCYSTFYQSLMFEFDLKYGDVSWINGLFQGGYGLGNLLFPIIYKYVTFRIGVMTSAIVSSTAIFVSSFAVTIWQIHVCCGLVTGFCIAGSIIGLYGEVTRCFKKNREIVYQVVCTGTSLGGFIFCPLFQLLINVYHWRGALWIISGIYFQLAAGGAILGLTSTSTEKSNPHQSAVTEVIEQELNHDIATKEIKNETQGGKTTLISHLYDKWDLKLFLRADLYLYVLGWFTFSLSFYLALLFMIPYGSKIGLTDIQASSLASAVGFGELGSRVFYSVVMKKCPHTYRYVFLSIIVATTSIPFFSLVALKSYPVLLTIFVVVGVMGGGVDAVYNNLLIDIFGVSMYPSAYGYANVISYPMGMLGTVTLGHVIDLYGSETIAFIIGGCSLLLSSGFVLIMNQRIKKLQLLNTAE